MLDKVVKVDKIDYKNDSESGIQNQFTKVSYKT